MLDCLRRNLFGQIDPPSEEADQVEAALAKAYVSIERQAARREKDEHIVAVAGLLHELRFLQSDSDVITQDVLVAFRDQQYDPWFIQPPWPRALDARIEFLFERLNHQWRAVRNVQ